MPKLFDLSDDAPLGEISGDDLAELVAKLGLAPDADRSGKIDNDVFLKLTEAGASAALLDAIKTAVDRRGNVGIRWEAD